MVPFPRKRILTREMFNQGLISLELRGITLTLNPSIKCSGMRSRNNFTSHVNSSGARVLIDGNVVSNQTKVSTEWATHFEQLGSSKVPESPVLQDLQSAIACYQSSSF